MGLLTRMKRKEIEFYGSLSPLLHSLEWNSMSLIMEAAQNQAYQTDLCVCAQKAVTRN